ncbi:MAG: FMN-binding protein [Candidatus Sedimenticola endophacoides]
MSIGNGVKEPGSARLALSLAFAGFISGLAIIAIYEATLPTITANKAEELRQAVFRVLPGVTRIRKFEPTPEGLKENPEARGEEVVYGGYDPRGELVGYAINSAGPGFQDTIRVLYGYVPAERRVLGMWILESRETPGLGDKIYKDAEFVANFEDLAIEPQIVAVKKGTRSAPNEIDAITGATISSKAVARIINEGHQRWKGRLPAPDGQPGIEEAEQ